MMRWREYQGRVNDITPVERLRVVKPAQEPPLQQPKTASDDAWLLYAAIGGLAIGLSLLALAFR